MKTNPPASEATPMTKHEEALRLANKLLPCGKQHMEGYDFAFSRGACPVHSARAGVAAALAEHFILGWKAGAEAQREADAKEWESRSGLYNADAVYRLILDVPLVTLDDAKGGS